MKKKLLAILLAVMLVVSACAIIACDNTPKHKVTFYDGKTVLKEVEVKDGEKVEAYTPTKDGGYQFIDWYSTPSFGHKFDFDKAVTEDVSIFAGFTLFKDDTRTYYVLGSGTSTLLIGSDWGKVITDDHKMTKATGKNEYTITMDLLEGDEFQFATSTAWEAKRGYGYLVTDKLPDGTLAFSGEGGGLGEVTAKGRNIKVAKSGNYTFTLKTYPNEDTYNTSDSTYTEANKEVYNVGTFDTIEFVRNGDPLVTKVVVTNYYIKGNLISGWKDMYNAAMTMVKSGDTYTLETYLKAGDEFMFASYNTSVDGITAGSSYIKATNLDDASASVVEALSGGNIKAIKSGMHKFVYNKTTDKLTVTVDETKGLTALDYYLDGKTASGINWKATDLVNHKLVEKTAGSGVYVLENVALAVNDELVIRSYAKGTQIKDYSNKLTDYDARYLLDKLTATANFGIMGGTNNNIKVLVAGNYDITFDAYSSRISIVTHVDSNDTLDIYIKGDNVGDQVGWKHNFDAKYRFILSGDGLTYEYTLTVEAGKTVTCGLEKHPKGETEGSGDFIAAGALGTAGDANAAFTPASGSNLTCSTAGAYKMVYTIATGKLDIYAVTNA